MSEFDVIALFDSLLTENTGRIARYSKAADRDAERRGSRQEGADRMVAHAQARQESLKQARSAIAALQAEREWRPIASCPCDDETFFLAYVPGRGIFECKVLPSGMGGYYVWKNLPVGGSEIHRLDREYLPTHWMPLPAPPTTEGGERG